MPFKKLGESRVQIEDKVFDFNDIIEKALNDTTRKSLKELSDIDEVKFLDMLETIGYY